MVLTGARRNVHPMRDFLRPFVWGSAPPQQSCDSPRYLRHQKADLAVILGERCVFKAQLCALAAVPCVDFKAAGEMESLATV